MSDSRKSATTDHPADCECTACVAAYEPWWYPEWDLYDPGAESIYDRSERRAEAWTREDGSERGRR